MNNKDINKQQSNIFDNAKTAIDFLNETYDQFMWENQEMGQRRVAVPTRMIKTEYNQAGEKGHCRREFEAGHL